MMDCTDLEFHSQLDGWNVVSFATDYVTVVEDPASVRLLGEGQRLDPGLRGHILRELTAGTPDVTEADRAGLPRARGRQALAVFSDPITGEPARDASGKLLVMQVAKKGAAMPGLKSLVGWRANTGLRIAHRGSAAQVLDALSGAFPEVNVLRLDFNAAVARSPGAAEAWADFAGAAADRGYKLVVQYSDGELAGGFVRNGSAKQHMIASDRLGPADALARPDGQWKINEVREDWEEILKWFRQPEHASILDAVAGWELVNEPMAYGRDAAAGALYSRHMADLITGLDWGDKRILVGGLGASAQFARLDHDLIRDAAGDRLVWSVHMYPGWVTAPFPDSGGTVFRKQVCDRIGTLAGEGDDILVSESQLHTAEGSLDPTASGKRAVASYNMARMLPWFADQGIGWTWWPPTGRKSDLLQWQGSTKEYAVELESAAFAHWGWSRGERGSLAGGGSSGDDQLAVDPSGPSDAGHVTSGVSNPHGLIYGMEGADRITGHDRTDLLYGGPGADTIEGGDGDDWLFGDQGADALSGGAGRDVLIDPEGDNTLSGGAGDDHLEGQGALDGGPGDDLLIAAPSGVTTMTGGKGADRFLPDVAGEVTITDFTPGEDVLDLAILGAQRCKPEWASEADGLVMTLGDLRLRILGVSTLEEDDIINRGRCRLPRR